MSHTLTYTFPLAQKLRVLSRVQLLYGVRQYAPTEARCITIALARRDLLRWLRVEGGVLFTLLSLIAQYKDLYQVSKHASSFFSSIIDCRCLTYFKCKIYLFKKKVFSFILSILLKCLIQKNDCFHVFGMAKVSYTRYKYLCYNCM